MKVATGRNLDSTQYSHHLHHPNEDSGHSHTHHHHHHPFKDPGPSRISTLSLRVYILTRKTCGNLITAATVKTRY